MTLYDFIELSENGIMLLVNNTDGEILTEISSDYKNSLSDTILEMKVSSFRIEIVGLGSVKLAITVLSDTDEDTEPEPDTEEPDDDSDDGD